MTLDLSIVTPDVGKRTGSFISSFVTGSKNSSGACRNETVLSFKKEYRFIVYRFCAVLYIHHQEQFLPFVSILNMSGLSQIEIASSPLAHHVQDFYKNNDIL